MIRSRSFHGTTGSATVAAALAVVVLIGVTGAMLSVSLGASHERDAAGAKVRAFAAANSGLAHTVANMASGTDASQAAVGTAAVSTTTVSGAAKTTVSPENGVHFADSYYWTSVTDNGDGTFTVRSTGSSSAATETVEAVVRQTTSSSIYDNAIFAGNSDDDPLYTLDLGGTGTQADEVIGDVYSGGDVVLDGDADVDGMIRSKGGIVGASGESNVTLASVDLAAMNYESTADVMVKDEFSANSTYEYDEAGGDAWQVPEENAAHIFRLNPSDRTSETGSTAKDDYFLEDPYENVRTDKNQNGSDAYRLTLSGGAGKPGIDSNESVFFIDGNLWLHNKQSYSMKFYHPEKDGTKLTFVVKGNIYISDNLFLLNKNKDGIALIAMKDDQVADSGNIYFGDPEFGTLKEMNAFMYAENDFYDYNLDADGSSTVTVRGNMTAGNKVDVQRDYDGKHTKLMVDFDDRISTGDLEMPGLPSIAADKSKSAYEFVSWARVAN